jgi:hypothetical protein
MLDYDVLDEVAQACIPNKIHYILHVNPRQAWVDMMIQILDQGLIKSSYDNLYEYASNWEEMLYYRYSKLN